MALDETPRLEDPQEHEVGLRGESLLLMEARLEEEALLQGRAILSENACLRGRAVVEDRAYVGGHALVHGEAHLGGFTTILGYGDVAQEDHALTVGPFRAGEYLTLHRAYREGSEYWSHHLVAHERLEMLQGLYEAWEGTLPSFREVFLGDHCETFSITPEEVEAVTPLLALWVERWESTLLEDEDYERWGCL